MKLIEEENCISRPGGILPVFSVRPDKNSAHPGIILLHEIFGVNEHIKDLARRFAKQSYSVFVPDLFAYSPGLPENRNDLQAMRQVWNSIRDEQLIDDIAAVFYQARRSSFVQPQAIGAMGFCIGGAMAFMFACRQPLLSWVVDFYGRVYYQDLTDRKPRHPISFTGGLNCPLLGLFAGVDDLIPESHIQDLEAKLKDLGKKYQIKVYPTARHAFFNDQREFYHYEAAGDSWGLTLAFIEANSHGSAK